MKQFNLEEYLANPSKKVVTRDGRNVKIHCTNYNSPQPIIAEIEGSTYSSSFWENGRVLSHEDSPGDLFFATEKHEMWVNVYKRGSEDYALGADIYISKELAEMVAGPNCVGSGTAECIPYNEETKHLVGTTEDCPEFYKWWEK